MVYVLGPKNRARIDVLKSKGVPVIMTTSNSDKDWSRGLSPFFLGPCCLYKNFTARRMENAWQFSKVYKEHIGSDGNPSQEYFEWAHKGWSSDRAFRYPMGKGRIPEYSWWDGLRLGYVEARKRIYAPLYIRAVAVSPAFSRLKKLHRENENLCLWDFDAYDHRAQGMSYQDVLECHSRKMGHAFVLAMMLEDHDLVKQIYENRV